MALAVCLLFDDAGDRTIRQLWRRLEARGLSTPLSHTHGRHRPHLSLAVLRSWELPAVLDALALLPVGEPVHLQFQGVLAFPRGRVSLATAVGAELYRRQEAIARALLAAGLDLHKYYLPGRWIPHVSVATRGSAQQLPEVAVTVLDAIPIHANAVQAALIDSSTGESWPLR
ncbi:MAG: 2'-5' RNA ligase family protein [Brooklawnia sp.]|uniref:2'-5' RNA ligase family protein n=1 Tax=Brooklawnia sp. TaxID=2699740 RepID=UPI003C72373C